MTLDPVAQFSHEPAGYIREYILFGKKIRCPATHSFYVPVRSGGGWSTEFTDAEYRACKRKQLTTPVSLMHVGRRRWWWFRNSIFHHPIDEDDPKVIKGLILQKLHRAAKAREKAIKVAESEPIGSEDGNAC